MVLGVWCHGSIQTCCVELPAKSSILARKSFSSFMGFIQICIVVVSMFYFFGWMLHNNIWKNVNGYETLHIWNTTTGWIFQCRGWDMFLLQWIFFVLPPPPFPSKKSPIHSVKSSTLSQQFQVKALNQYWSLKIPLEAQLWQIEQKMQRKKMFKRSR